MLLSCFRKRSPFCLYCAEKKRSGIGKRLAVLPWEFLLHPLHFSISRKKLLDNFHLLIFKAKGRLARFRLFCFCELASVKSNLAHLREISIKRVDIHVHIKLTTHGLFSERRITIIESEVRDRRRK